MVTSTAEAHATSTKWIVLWDLLRLATPTILGVVVYFVTLTNAGLAELNESNHAQTLSIELLSSSVEDMQGDVAALSASAESAKVVIQDLSTELAVMKVEKKNAERLESFVTRRLDALESRIHDLENQAP